MMTEALVYIGVLFLLGGVGLAALYRCIDNSVALRRSADDITSVLHAGERWRADVRAAGTNILFEGGSPEQVLTLQTARGPIRYRSSTNSVYRRVGTGTWTTLLQNVRSSQMAPDTRQTIAAWRWELELGARRKSSRIRPLFTFVAVPQPSETK